VWSEMSGDDRRRGIQDGLRAILGRELTMPEAEIHSDLPFVEIGLNSMMAMSIRREAEQLVGIELSTTMLWKYPTITTLAAYLAKKLSPQGQAEESDAPSDSTNGVLNDLFDRIEGSSS
jgi:phthiocerol/phenolphthiocerol synthesis type-I polyketide synthase A